VMKLENNDIMEFAGKWIELENAILSEEKSKFEDLAKSDKARYDREMKNYFPSKGDKKGKKKDPSYPKRPPSAFFLFCSEHRPKIKSEHPGLSIRDIAKKLGEMWSEQSAKDKQPYEQRAARMKEKKSFQHLHCQAITEYLWNTHRAQSNKRIAYLSREAKCQQSGGLVRTPGETKSKQRHQAANPPVDCVDFPPVAYAFAFDVVHTLKIHY
ncbi:hypothetical protein STEG23_014154, partial [Scotinomys teguina]